MKIKISDESFAKAVDEECKKSLFGGNENFRFAIATLARDIRIAAEWTGASPPAIVHAALGVVCRAVWNSFGRQENDSENAVDA